MKTKSGLLTIATTVPQLKADKFFVEINNKGDGRPNFPAFGKIAGEKLPGLTGSPV